MKGDVARIMKERQPLEKSLGEKKLRTTNDEATQLLKQPAQPAHMADLNAVCDFEKHEERVLHDGEHQLIWIASSYGLPHSTSQIHGLTCSPMHNSTA